MPYSKQLFGDEARDALIKGFNIVNQAVSATAGPGGRTAAVQYYNDAPKITKDGVSVAKSISVPDAEGEGVKMIVQASQKTANEAGDGTTATVILANEIAHRGIKAMKQGCNVTELKKGIDYAVNQMIEKVEEHSKPIETNEEIKHIATVSANGDEEIGQFISQAIEKIGKDGVITIEEAKGFKSEIEIVDGMKIDRGYLSPYFITNPDKMSCEFDNPLILLYDDKINDLKSCITLLEQAMQSGRPILIIADDVEGEALATMVVNKFRAGLKICAIKAPEFGNIRLKVMEDLAVLLDGQFVSTKKGVKLENVGITACGTCDKVKITADSTTFIGGAGDKEKIKERIEEISSELKNSESDYDKEKLKERKARLANGVAILKVGGATEMEMKEKKDRVDDAVCATTAAIEEGIIVGGGVALPRIAGNELNLPADKSYDFYIGCDIVKDAVSAPIKKIAENAGQSGDVIMANVMSSNDFNYGYNARNDCYGNLVEQGVIDPSKVVKSALRNGASVASCLLTTEVLIYDDFETNKARLSNQGQQMNY